jgi:hypothetical protein
MIASRKVGPRSGFVKATFSLAPEQLAELLKEAKARADRLGTFRPDASEVVRDVLAGWLKTKCDRGEG